MPPWRLASCPTDPFLPPWCLASCPMFPGAALSKGIQSVLGSRPWRPPQDLPRTGPFAIEIVLKVRQNPAPFQNHNSIGNPALQASLVPPWCLQVALSCLWCLPGASQAVQLILSLHVKGNSVCAGQPAPPWAAGRGAHPRICREPGRSPLKLY